MSENNGSPRETDFPSSEEFTDFAGRTRRFTLEQYPVPLGYGVCASEDVEGDDGYVFRAFSTVDPVRSEDHRFLGRIGVAATNCNQG